MKRTIDYYSITLLKRNSLYLIAIFIFLVLLFVVLPQKIAEYTENKGKITVLAKEISQLTEQDNLVNAYSKSDLEAFLKAMSLAIPDHYTMFTIFGVIDEFEKKSGLKFISYTSPANQISDGGVSLSVTAQGSPEAIRNFLTNYKTFSGRIVSIDNIVLIPSSSTLQFTMIFHSKANAATENSIPKLNQDTLATIQRLYENYQQQVPAEESSTASPESTFKANPFTP